ncbi:MAG: dTMP kinase [Candidatus Levybacteria bacterium]|nr:dTMP kinase [Candidatus Levybacteria bacterium]
MRYHISFDIDFRRNPFTGVYIAFEGIDGSGKSTQLDRLKRSFEKAGKKVITTSEPKRDFVVGKLIHEVLQAKIEMPPEALQYLYSADRAINHNTVVLPALEKGKVVLSHRSFWSVVPYGMHDKGIIDYKNDTSKALLMSQGLLSMYHQFVAPDVTFFLDIPVEIAMKRLSKMKKVKELYEKKERLKNIAEGYHWLIKQFPNQFVILDGTQAEDVITQKILGELKKRKILCRIRLHLM